MFLRRKKFLVFLAVIGIAWIAITTLLGRSSHSEVQTQRNRQKSGSRLRQPEFYYDSEDEVIELEAAKTWAKVKASTQWIGNKWSTAPSIVNRHGQEEHELRHDEQELEEILEDNGIPEIKKWPVAQMHQSEFGSDLVQGQTTRVVKWAGLHWTPATDLKDHNAPDPPGHNGSAVLVEEDRLSHDEKKQYNNGWTKYAHNEFVSRLVSLHRVLPDVRDPECKNVKYSGSLPDVSVIMTFHNEAWTTLLRAIHSIIDRSPPKLLTEIILVDDFSDEDHLKQQLDDYLQLLPKVRLVRVTEQLGVVRARQQGAVLAKGSVLVFLDSHVECTIGWLEPLLQRIALNRTTVAIPVMDIIDDTTFQYKAFDAGSINIGGFDWNLQFTWIGIPEREKQRQSSVIVPIRSPTMSGGMYAINRKWFNHLGGYDIGMDMWGGENLEVSFRVSLFDVYSILQSYFRLEYKVWMCGGTLEVVPCSHVGHVFRKRSVYQLANDNTNPRKNFMRLAEVWMDNYKTHYYDKIGGRPNSDDVYGDVTERKELRTKLHCQSFQWYLRNVYPELFIPNDALAFGEIRSQVNVVVDKRSQQVCLDSIVGQNAFNLAVKIWPCHGQGGNQYWLLSSLGEIRRDDSCFDYAGKSLVIYPCHGQRGNQQWQYTPIGQIRHLSTKRCLELSVESSELRMSPCGKSERQIWKWKRNKPSESMIDEVDSEVVEEQNEPIRLRPQSPFASNQKPVVQEIAGDDY